MLSAIGAGEEVVAASEYRALQHQLHELQRLLGKNTLENEILREALDLAQPKTVVAVAITGSRGYPVKRVAQTLGVARSNLVVQASAEHNPATPWQTARAGRRVAGRDQGRYRRAADLRLSARSCAAPATAMRTRRRAGEREAGLPGDEGARPFAPAPHRQRRRATA